MKPINSRNRSVKHGAFTLVEMIIVIGIIVLLAAMLLPAIGRARRSAVRTALLADLQTIATGIDAYKLDFKDIPRVDGNGPGPFQGSAILCWTLIAPGNAAFDGADGFGFRPRGTQGQVYGPYITPGMFRLGTVTKNPLVQSTLVYDGRVCLADRQGNAILYYPSRPSVTSIASIDIYFGAAAPGPNRYVADDNDPAVATGTEYGKNPDAAAALKSMQLLLPGVSVMPDGSVKLIPSELLNLPYLLWDAGQDGKFGTSDDVGNFQK